MQQKFKTAIFVQSTEFKEGGLFDFDFSVRYNLDSSKENTPLKRTLKTKCLKELPFEAEWG